MSTVEHTEILDSAEVAAVASGPVAEEFWTSITPAAAAAAAAAASATSIAVVTDLAAADAAAVVAAETKMDLNIAAPTWQTQCPFAKIVVAAAAEHSDHRYPFAARISQEPSCLHHRLLPGVVIG